MNGNGNGNGSQVSHWKLMLVGTFSVTFRRVFVIGLTVLSLAVWTVTVIGMGVLRQSGGEPGGTVQSAEASLIPPTRAMPAEPPAPQAAVESPLAAKAGPEAEPGTPGDEVSLRDPFAASERCFPRAAVASKKDTTVLEQPKEDGKTPGLRRDQLIPLRLEGTMTLGTQKVAIVQGNSFELSGRTMLLMLDDIRKLYGVGEEKVIAKDAFNHLKVGDTFEVRPITASEDRIRLGEDVLTLEVLTITNTKVILMLGDKTYELEMKK